ncbi:MAG: hypothetical protein N2449_09730, partial [Bacteroidales bacterium]|nr:hypothetical protein [Bacteroidales bacterium]
MRWWLNIVLLFFVTIAFAQPPRLTIVNGTRLNSNNYTSNINITQNVCWVNNTPSSNITLNNVTVRFSGTGLQYIDGTQPTPFYNLRIAKTGSAEQLDVYLNQNISIANELYMESGYLDLRNFIITFSNTATIQNEAAGRRVKATDRVDYTTLGSYGEGYGTGYITTTRTNPTGNVANLGLDFSPVGGNLGSTEIRRGHQRLPGTGTFNGNRSVSRYYRLQPTTMRQLIVNNFYYIEDGTPELFTHPEANLQMFQTVQYWNGSTNPTYWEPRTSTPNTSSNFVQSTTTSNPMMINYILITLGSTTQPLPVEYLTFYGVCNSNINTIYWQTASESNNAGFYIEKSTDGENWNTLAFINGNGTINSISSYQYTDPNPFTTTYYRLKQIDIDGNVSYSSIISVQCHHQPLYSEDFYPVYSSDKPITIIVQGIPGEEYSIVFTNLLGQQLLYKKFTLSAPQEAIQFFDNLSTTGLYYITFIGTQTHMT